MAVNLNAPRRTARIRCFYYAPEYIDNNSAIKPNAVVKGVFYATNTQPVSRTVSARGTVRSKKLSTTLVTYDVVEDMNNDDYIFYNGKLWIIDNLQSLSIPENKTSIPLSTRRMASGVTQIAIRTLG